MDIGKAIKELKKGKADFRAEKGRHFACATWQAVL